MTLKQLESTVESLIKKSITRNRVSSIPIELPTLNLKVALKASVGNTKHDLKIQRLITRGWLSEDSIGYVWYRNPGGYITWVARWYQPSPKNMKMYIVYLQEVFIGLTGDKEWPFKP